MDHTNKLNLINMLSILNSLTSYSQRLECTLNILNVDICSVFR
jgi:hypothetical protein